MTTNKTTAIANINAIFQTQLDAINERRDNRMRNYYDCVDDYSFGGLCDNADNIREDQLRRWRDIKIEEINNDGYHVENGNYWGLKDASGNIVAKGINCGQYGPYFNVNGVFVGLPKKLSTLTKKGYVLFNCKRTYKCVMKEINYKGYLINNSMNLISEKIVDWSDNNIPYSDIKRMPYSDYQFENRFMIG